MCKITCLHRSFIHQIPFENNVTNSIKYFEIQYFTILFLNKPDYRTFFQF